MMRCRASRHQDLPGAGHRSRGAPRRTGPGDAIIEGMDHQQARRFAASWVEAWNAHDVDAVLDHFADDAVFISPVAAQLLDDSDGVLRGKPAIGDYWRRGVELIPDLHFEVVGVYVGLSTLVINYRNQKGAW